jgi:hypothetical protein
MSSATRDDLSAGGSVGAEVQSFVSGASGLAGLLSEDAPQIAERVRKIVATVLEERVTVGFCGVFNAGKSTLMNAALGRNLMPVGALPESGAICALQSGAADSAEVVESGRRRPIPCSMEAIHEEITLVAKDGSRRPQVLGIDRVDVALGRSIIPPRVRWVDSPGYNDQQDMALLSRRAAAEADVVVWVLRSRQLLSEPEMIFLASHIGESGPASVVFIMNALLRSDTEEDWQRFLKDIAPQWVDRIRHYAPDMGFTQSSPPEITIVAARAMCKEPQNFGGAELKRLLVGVDSRLHPRVMRTRLWRAARALAQCIPLLDERIAAEVRRLEQRTREVTEVNAEAERKRLLREALAQTTTQFMDEFQTAVSRAAAKLVGRLTDVATASPVIGAPELNADIAKVAREASAAMFVRINSAARKYQERPLDAGWINYFETLCAPPRTTVDFSSTFARTRAAIAMMNKMVGKEPPWLEEGRAKISGIVGGIVSAMRARHATFAAQFDQLYSLRAATLPAPDARALDRLRGIRVGLNDQVICARRAACPDYRWERIDGAGA